MKKITLSIMGLLLITSTLFASGSSDGKTTWFNANKKADAASYYTPTSRLSEVTYFSLSGEEITSESAEATYSLSNYGNVIKRSISGDSSVYTLLDKIYDGYILTPFEDEIAKLDKEYVGEETVDGVNCDVFSVEVALDKNLFFFGSSNSGEIIGYDSDEDDFDGSMTILIYINKESNEIVKQVATYTSLDTLPDLEIVQTTTYSSFDIEGESITLPSTVVTEGSYKEKAGSSSVYDITSFIATENYTSYQYNKNYDHK